MVILFSRRRWFMVYDGKCIGKSAMLSITELENFRADCQKCGKQTGDTPNDLQVGQKV